MKKILCLVLITCSIQDLVAQKEEFTHEIGTFTDPRDGQTYKTITFRREFSDSYIKRTWYAENARFDLERSVCYSNNDANCSEFGKLYTWEDANQACPDGWHVPTLVEWKHLFNFFGGINNAGQFLHEGKASDMNMLYGGFSTPDGTFNNLGLSGNWWDNQLQDENTAGVISLQKGSNNIYHSKVGVDDMLSCRCIRYDN